MLIPLAIVSCEKRVSKLHNCTIACYTLIINKFSYAICYVIREIEIA